MQRHHNLQMDAIVGDFGLGEMAFSFDNVYASWTTIAVHSRVNEGVGVAYKVNPPKKPVTIFPWAVLVR